MARLFITNREIDLINDITKQVIKDVIGQEVIYYSINEEKTRANALYNESDVKIFDTPIAIRALVEYTGEKEVTATKFGIDNIFDLTIFFHKKDLADRDISIREGDFCQYGERFYEIMSLTRPKDIFGQQENIPGIHAACRIAREGQFRTATVDQPANFHVFRGTSGHEGIHDKRELQTRGKVSPITGSLHTHDLRVASGSLY